MDKRLQKLYDRREELCFELIEADGYARDEVEKELDSLDTVIDKLEEEVNHG